MFEMIFFIVMGNSPNKFISHAVQFHGWIACVIAKLVIFQRIIILIVCVVISDHNRFISVI